MRQPAALGALLATLAGLWVTALPARAELDASGTRLAIAGGPARFYMTYGHIEDVELYAPVIPALRAAGVVLEKLGDNYRVFVRGHLKAEWPIVTRRDEIPETGEPCVLEMGGQTFVPVRRLSEIARLEVKWDRRGNLVALVPAPESPTAVRPAPPAADLKPASLTAVELENRGATVEVRVRTSHPVRPSLLRVTGPTRLVLDFPEARWAEGLSLPAGAGAVKGLRTGYPPTGAARLTLEVTAADFNVTAVRVDAEVVTATLSRGIQTRQMAVSPEATQLLAQRDALRRRANPLMARGSRGGPLDENPLVPRGPDDPDSIIPIPPPAAPEVGGPSRFVPVANLQGRVIVVDPGHGGKHIGASGLIHTEKELCLKMGFELRRALLARGATVIMTRTTDVFVSLDERCRIANESGAHIFISIHCNAMPRRDLQSGTETYWHSSEQSRRLARALHPRVVGTVRGRDGGIRNRSFAVIRETNMPSVLLEIAYLNHTQDELILADPVFHGRLADNVAQGVLDYFGREVN